MFGCLKHFWINISIWIYWQRENKVHFCAIRSDALNCLTSSSITFHLRSDWKKRSKVELHLLTSWQMIGVFLCFALLCTSHATKISIICITGNCRWWFKLWRLWLKGWKKSRAESTPSFNEKLYIWTTLIFTLMCVCACTRMGVRVCAWVCGCVLGCMCASVYLVKESSGERERERIMKWKETRKERKFFDW